MCSHMCAPVCVHAVCAHMCVYECGGESYLLGVEDAGRHISSGRCRPRAVMVQFAVLATPCNDPVSPREPGGPVGSEVRTDAPSPAAAPGG